MTLIKDQVWVRVSVTVALLTRVTCTNGVAIVTRSTPLTVVSSITDLTHTPQSHAPHITVCSKVVGLCGDRACTWPTLVLSIMRNLEKVTIFTPLTEITCTMILTTDADSSDVLTVVGMAFTVTRQTGVLFTPEEPSSTHSVDGILLGEQHREDAG